MRSQTMAREIALAALDKKAQNVAVLDLKRLTHFTDYFVICTGNSDRQVQAIADAIQERMREARCQGVGVEGYRAAQWILLDYGDVVAHVFYDGMREVYQLEKLWEDARRVRLKGVNQ